MQALLAGAAGLQLAVIAWNNCVDWGSNYAFVQHVLSMDTVFPGSSLVSRAATAPWVHAVFYATIIGWETAAAALCLAGAWRMSRALHDGVKHYEAKGLAATGLTLSLLLWLVAFLTVGGEWFAMWQSSKWNGVEAAGRMFAVHGIVLLLMRGRE